MAIQHTTMDYGDGETVFEGSLAWDDASDGPRPLVLVAHAWGGRDGFVDGKCLELASHGYTAFAVDVYGKGVRGSSREENAALMTPLIEDRALLLQRLRLAHSTARELDTVDAARTAILGYCFGGLCALDLARSGDDLTGAISLHGLLMPTDTTATIQARVLALHGWDDPMVPPDAVTAFAAEMSQANADWQLHAYGNTFHAFTNPQANDPDFGTVYSELADRRSWRSSLDFLEDIFAE